jgi:hypothetical protein
MRADLLRPGLSHVKPGPDNANRRDVTRRDMLGEPLSSPGLQ